MNSLTINPIAAQIGEACGRIAPNWPLDKLIAVNPWWQLRHKTMHEVAIDLSWLGGIELYGTPELYSQVSDLDLEAALSDLGRPETATQFRRQNLTKPRTWMNLDQLADQIKDPEREVFWQDEITHQLSQFAGDYFMTHSEHERGADCSDFYQEWLDSITHDPALGILMNCPGLSDHFRALATDPTELIEQTLETLRVPQELRAEYLHALLLSINGWASYCAWIGWQANLSGEENAVIQQLLAARVAWELVLWRILDEGSIKQNWRYQLSKAQVRRAQHKEYIDQVQVWFIASEKRVQRQLHAQLSSLNTRPTDTISNTLELQAVFCIDTRSEVIRRALEHQSTSIQTKGFAGFFGLPIAYSMGGYQRPQLPGLLAPQLEVSETHTDQADRARLSSLWQQFAKSSAGGFSLVESSGLVYLGGMIKNVLGVGKDKQLERGRLRLSKQGTPLSLNEQVELAQAVLSGMGFTDQFAPHILLLGHGSQCQNNPHEAGLECGACGGQSGEVNVRLLCQLLNDRAVRIELANRNWLIPENTRFVPGVHNTTTDQIDLLETLDDREILDWLDEARVLASSERRNLSQATQAAPAAQKKARDWSQTRPEWGLANNACFIIADRSKTRGLNLNGRSFLHDYNWQNDTDSSLLTLILTAPMLVTNWINMQYNASVTEPLKYGAGNKTLHNIVGGSIGVFEGNGGDLRIGLPLQSVHDGAGYMHQPTRLNVYVDAPKEMIARIVEAQPVVKELVDNEWLFLYRMADELTEIERYQNQCWHGVTNTL